MEMMVIRVRERRDEEDGEEDRGRGYWGAFVLRTETRESVN